MHTVILRCCRALLQWAKRKRKIGREEYLLLWTSRRHVTFGSRKVTVWGLFLFVKVSVGGLPGWYGLTKFLRRQVILFGCSDSVLSTDCKRKVKTTVEGRKSGPRCTSLRPRGRPPEGGLDRYEGPGCCRGGYERVSHRRVACPLLLSVCVVVGSVHSATTGLGLRSDPLRELTEGPSGPRRFRGDAQVYSIAVGEQGCVPGL